MLLPEDELRERMESPMNLLNRLRKITNPHTLVPPALPPSADEVVEDLEEKIKTGSIKSKALGLVSDALDELKIQLPSIQRPEKLASIAESMSKIINNTEPKRNESSVQAAQIIIYAPQMMSEEDFNVVHLQD